MVDTWVNTGGPKVARHVAAFRLLPRLLESISNSRISEFRILYWKNAAVWNFSQKFTPGWGVIFETIPMGKSRLLRDSNSGGVISNASELDQPR